MTVWIRQLLAILCAFFLLEFYYGESKCSSPITAQYSHLVNTSNFLQYSNLICLALPVKAFPLWLLLNFLCKAQRCILLFFLALSRCKCSSAFLQYFRIWTSQCSAVFPPVLVPLALWFQLTLMQVIQNFFSLVLDINLTLLS